MRLAGLNPARGRGNTPQPAAGRCGPAIPASCLCIPPRPPFHTASRHMECLLLDRTSSAFAGACSRFSSSRCLRLAGPHPGARPGLRPDFPVALPGCRGKASVATRALPQ